MSDENFLTREISLIGNENVEKLKKARVIVFGLGGVGGALAEALVRAGIGNLTIVDGDSINVTNINRQAFAFNSTIGAPKTDAAEAKLLDINKHVKITKISEFYNEITAKSYNFANYDYICDAIDSVNEKILLIKNAVESGTPIISSMGTGNKLHPEMLELSDISKTAYCPLAKAVRTGLRHVGINHLNVVYSKEPPIETGSRTPASISFVPPAAGMIMAGKVVRDIINKE